MNSFEKTVHLGATRFGNVVCKIVWATFGGQPRLSISGTEGRDHGGQIVMGMRSDHFLTFEPGWDADKVGEFLYVWNRWHLNDMRAGSPAQEEWVRGWKVNHNYDFKEVKTHLEAVGLDPDSTFAHGGRPYYWYGTAWLYEAVPDGVLAWLKALPGD